MDSELLEKAAVALSKCGHPIIHGAQAVPIPRTFVVPMVLSPGQSVTYIKEITGETTWSLRAISSSVGSANALTGVRLQIQLPNGRYLFGGKNGIDVGQFAWIGSYRYLVDPALDCEPGSKIRVTLSDIGTLASDYPVTLTFEGAYLFYLKSNERNKPLSQASDIPRYQGIVNENILAPCYVAGVGPATPPGFEDDLFTYATDTATITIGSTSLTATLRATVDNGLDFHCRRILFRVQCDAGVTAGVFLARIRAGSGYALCDSWMDVARYIGGAEFPVDWRIKSGDDIFVDLSLADGAGAGTMSCTAFFEGVKRRRL